MINVYFNGQPVTGFAGINAAKIYAARKNGDMHHPLPYTVATKDDGKRENEWIISATKIK